MALFATLLGGCGPAAQNGPSGSAAGTAGSAPAAPAAAAASAAPVSVTLVRAQARDFTLTLEANGTVTTLSSVEVKPQVSAQVLAVHVKEGQFVQRGAPLFTLDARAEQANADAQQAVVAADQAAIDAVRVQLSYARISAPSAGRVGQILVYPGSSVSPGGTAMLTLTQIDPVAVAFSLPQRNLPDALAALGSAAGAKTGGRAGAVVTATLPDMPAGSAPGRGQRQGRLSFVDSAVDAASGTVRAKALFANADQALWPGAYVNVKMALQTLPGAIVVPQAAIVLGARGSTVFVAGPGNVAAVRPVKLLASAGTEAVVSGLQAGERVVLDGRQNVRPGMLLQERPERAADVAGAGAGGTARALRAGGASGAGTP